MLYLNVGITVQLAIAESDAVMLSHIPIATHTGGVLQQESFMMTVTGDDIDHAGDGIRAVEGRGSTLHHLYLLDVLWVDQRQIILTTVVTMDALTIDKDEDIRVAQAVHLYLRPHITLVEVKR